MDEELTRWFDAVNKRGHAGMFARPSNAEKQVVERQTVEEWAVAMRAQFDIQITAIKSAERDPPDCTAMMDGAPVDIELAELLHDKILYRFDAARRGKMNAPSFDDLQWTEEKLHAAVRSILDKKEQRLARTNLAADGLTLLIYTDEPWLSPQQMEAWSPTCITSPPTQFSAVYLLGTYAPGYADHWPTFRLW